MYKPTHARPRRSHRAAATALAFGLVAGAALTVDAGSASALPRQCDVGAQSMYDHDSYEAGQFLGQYTTDIIEGNYGYAATDLNYYRGYIAAARATGC
jgi:hypothetical protein